ncbi:MAG: hypothetical protein QXI58_01055 [Candidatus Micrarchaeia archaeon]
MVNLEKERNKQLELAQKRLQQNIEDIKNLQRRLRRDMMLIYSIMI